MKNRPNRTVSLLAGLVAILTFPASGVGAATRRTVYGRASYPVGAGPIAIASGDLSGDGRPDIVTANPGDGTVSVLVAKPGGKFNPRVDYAAGTGPAAVALGDLDGDGSLDLVVVAQNCPGSVCGPGMLAIFRGHGDGSLAPATFAVTNPNPQEVTIADLDSDGDRDVAVTCAITTITQGPGTVDILLGNGDATFQPSAGYPAGDGVGGIVSADFTGDGTADLAITNGVAINVTHAVVVLQGNGDGSFHAPVAFDTSGIPTRLVAGRFDGDAALDLAVLAAGGSVVSLLLGNGDGTFPSRVDYPAGFGPSALTASDLDGDGDLDLAATAFTALTLGGSIGVLRGDGAGGFAPFDEYLTGPIGPSLIAGDFDADGTPDLAAPDRGGNVVIYRGVGGAALARPPSMPAGPAPSGVATADFNTDGALDLAVSNFFDGTISVLPGDGSGGFGYSAVPATGLDLGALVTGDFNKDGRADMAVTTGPKGVTVLLGAGDGTFNSGGTSFPTAPGPVALVTADFTRDGIPDLATANQAGSVSLLRGRGDGTFDEPVNSPAGPGPAGLASGDFNRDGRLDLVVAAGAAGSFGPGLVDVLFGLGDGRFEPAVVYNAGVSADAITVADLDGDHLLDLIVGTNLDVFGSVVVLRGSGGGKFKPGTISGAGGLTVAVGIADVNGDRKADVLALNILSNTVTILIGRGDGSLQLQTNYDPGPIPASFATGDFNGDGLPDIAVTNLYTDAVSVLLSDLAAPLSRNRRNR